MSFAQGASSRPPTARVRGHCTFPAPAGAVAWHCIGEPASALVLSAKTVLRRANGRPPASAAPK
jgi:hypothetical protein